MPTPFGIRRRLKKLLGLGGDAAPARAATPQVTLIVVGPDGTEQSASCDIGGTVLGAAGRLKRPITSGCSESTCGTCRVEILEGAELLSEQTGRERATLKDNNLPTTYRLSCRAELAAPGTVKLRAFELM